ncbi:MAG: hypothetical protein RBT42_00340 [Aquabacterium sp.]|jgi:regulator of protease activity HflC (stomatin/prohibitin superfamily)|uniref:hypothetical protein n=1 Tax=Aquabacterium sp. TaxID=1872578 RepID=UPI002A372083|nr:hypothetical protein [Aquabacterium sp.]MDX9842183.1 hypothetical protein [Aquabacterium sp.]
MPFERKPSPITFWTIVGAVTLGILMADAIKTVVVAVYARIELNNVIKELNAQTRKQQAEAHARAMAAKIQAEADAKAAQARINAQRQAEAMAHQRAIDKELAWKSYYTAPKVCQSPPDSAAFTKCANDHIKAREAFEQSYRHSQP